MEFNAMNFVKNISYLLTGMISIFLVIGVIMLITVILNKAFSDKE